jgi:hypothetical protein
MVSKPPNPLVTQSFSVGEKVDFSKVEFIDFHSFFILINPLVSTHLLSQSGSFDFPFNVVSFSSSSSLINQPSIIIEFSGYMIIEIFYHGFLG